MKQIILSLIAFIGASLNACMAKDIETSETRNLSGYTSIHIDGVATVCFTQSDTYSCRIEGKAKELARLTTTVENGILTIGQRIDHKREQNIQGATLYLSAPALEEVKLDGVGAFECEGALKAGDIRFKIDGVGTIKIADLHCQTVQIADLHCQTVQIDIDGVGKGNVNVYCDKLKARADGVGSLKLSGKARSADIKDGFLSKINDRRLKVGE